MRARWTAVAITTVLAVAAGCGGSDDGREARADSAPTPATSGASDVSREAGRTADGWNRVVLGLVELEVPGQWRSSDDTGDDIQIWSRQDHGIGQFQALSRDTTSDEMLVDAKQDASDNGNTLAGERPVEVAGLGTGYRFDLTLANGDVHDGLVLATIDGIAIDLLVDDLDETTPSSTADRVFASLKRAG